MEHTFNSIYYNRPFVCKECGGALVFKGVGEYHCEKCKAIEYDDYGKARVYLEKHSGATIAEIEEATGVSRRSLKQMVKEERFEVTQNSRVQLFCELCHEKIRSGRFCKKCEIKYHRELEEKDRMKRNIQMEGTGMGPKMDKGERRFER